MMSRAQLDEVAWKAIKSRPPLVKTSSLRPSDYAEIGARVAAGEDFEYVWSDFLHGFFAYRTADYFAQPSPANLSPGWRALLAGAAEYLSAEFDLPHPAWTDEPQYFLDRVWDPWEELVPEVQGTAERLLHSPEAFRKRNIAFESRNLVTL